MKISKSVLALIAIALVMSIGAALDESGEPMQVIADNLMKSISRDNASADSNELLQEVPVSEILRKIQNNESVEYDHIVVIGDLVLNHAKIRNHIRINDSQFDGAVNFDHTTFYKPLDLSGSRFTKQTQFVLSTFNDFVDFEESTYSAYADFSGSSFRSNGIFGLSSFKEKVSFGGAVFDGAAFFSFSSYGGNAIFGGVRFGGDAYLAGSKYNGNVDFEGSIFSKYASLKDSTFSGYTLFSGSTFDGYADFARATFVKDVYFSESRFRDNVDFSRSRFSKYSYFINCTFWSSSNFMDCQFEDDAIFKGAKFLGKLYLDRADYSNLFIRWHNIKELSFDDTVYLQLIENFKNLGYYPDADQCYVSYRIQNRQNLPLYYRPIDWLLWILYGYGTMPELPVIWSFFVILLCGGFFYFTADIETPDKKTTLMEAMYLSAAAFTSGARTLGGFVSTPEDVKVKGRARYVLAVEKLLGLLLVGLFLTALARTVIR